jgi:hypothetical protein
LLGGKEEMMKVEMQGRGQVSDSLTMKKSAFKFAWSSFEEAKRFCGSAKSVRNHSSQTFKSF